MGDPVGHFEIKGANRGALEEFYTKLFGWEIEHPEEFDYGPVRTGGEGGIDGGITSEPDDPSSGTRIFVQVSDLQASLDKAESLGGKTVVPPMDLPMVSLAAFTDPEGNWIGLVKEESGGSS